ncbi:MAG: primosomal protein N' [Actinomycetota bacterium]|nr:primosomal protein N' [Actinomycetota bacterium]
MSTLLRIAHVILDISTRGLSEPFDYVVPEALAGTAVVGAVVLVPLGPRVAIGYVVGLADDSDFTGLREILEVLIEAVFDSIAVELAKNIARENVSPLATAMRLFLPPGGSPRVVGTVTATGSSPDAEPQRGIWRAAKAGIAQDRLLRGRGGVAMSVLDRMIAKGHLVRSWELVRPGIGPVDERWVEITPSGAAFTPKPNATLQRSILDSLSQGPVRTVELSAQLGVSVASALQRLAEQELVSIYDRRRMRSVRVAGRSAPRHEQLTQGQSDALLAIRESEVGSVTVLDGVTGSGKTEVYLRAIESSLERGEGAIVLVPEISLTPQTVGRFRTRFGGEVAVMHSRLSAGERYDEWDRVARGEANIVVGARSALFAPVVNLGLVVIDEEHESSYKQGKSPRYHARTVAADLVSARGARLVLGSATPDLGTLHRCGSGEWRRVSMPERVGGSTLPTVHVVDMAREFEEGHRSMFSRAMLRELERVQHEAGKAVLLLNRRGFASFILCRECGYVPVCEQCSVSLTFHEAAGKLVCHHCGFATSPPVTCPECDSAYLKKFGAGTERVETELAAVTNMPITRMDADTTSGKGGHEKALARFEAQESGILLGTQMVAKGLDYPEVTLVGVINADTTLHMPDFRSGERTYQLLSQVAGRAGRGDKTGTVVIQTYWPGHPSIIAAAAHDRAPFFAQELADREALNYPPFGRLARVVVSGALESAVREQAGHIGSALTLEASPGVKVLGPGPAAISRLKGQYRWHLLVKGTSDSDLAGLLGKAIDSVPSIEGISIAPDVDPYDLL